MLILDRDGSVVGPESRNTARLQQAYIELVTEPGADLSTSIDQILTLVFDQLELSILDLRIRQASQIR
ncbi:MAG: hypothetical protein KatS3mg057_1439 [Herpetosiphonaceae bacterium]|nr:MAG: hypothetical protein KatS3mg057_1439 [Herpetosiphonaceae bacterium]